MALNTQTFESADALTQSFAEQLTRILQEGISQRGRATLVVSGGRTPVALFQTLSNVDLEWSRVDITLADERWVDETDEASNARLVKENLLQNKAKEARFISLKTDDADATDGATEVESRIATLQQPFDALILGMGEDGHTASLFPCSKEISTGLTLNSGRICLAVTPTTAPHQRISLTLPALLNSRNIFLHLTGAKKKDVLMQALETSDEQSKPITAVVNRAPVTLMWAP